MIKRITNPEEFKDVINDIDILFEDENKNTGHVFDLVHDKETIINSFSNKQILAWDVFVWANKEGEKYDAVGIFLNDKSVKFGIKIFVEFLWLSKNPKAGFKIFKEAVKFARGENFKYMAVTSVEKHPNSQKNKRLYKKLGFEKDSTTFIATL